MYCYTLINSTTCVTNELYLWSDISSEHPIFLRTVAELTKKNLPANIIEALMKVHQDFLSLNKKVNILLKELNQNPNNYPKHQNELRKLVNDFLVHDNQFLELLPKLHKFGAEDKVWQTLVDHITHEQDFMHQLFSNIKTQLR